MRTTKADPTMKKKPSEKGLELNASCDEITPARNQRLAYTLIFGDVEVYARCYSPNRKVPALAFGGFEAFETKRSWPQAIIPGTNRKKASAYRGIGRTGDCRPTTST